MPVAAQDQQLYELVSGAAPARIDEVLVIMRAIDAALPVTDGLKWFNSLYMTITDAVDFNPPPGGWQSPTWLRTLDVVFAGLYFAALAGFLSGSSDVPGSWKALFEARHRTRIDRIQFALAGINAHLNHDLALALLATDARLGVQATLGSAEHADYESVNALLETTLPFALMSLAVDTLGVAAQDTGKVGRMLAIWNTRAERDLAWTFADHLQALNGLPRKIALDTQDQITSVLGRALLLMA